MFDIYMARLHEITVILYAFSILLYFVDFLMTNRKANRIAFWLLAFVWVLQTVFLTLFMLKTGRFPVLTISEGLYFYAWILISLSLVFNRLLKMDFIIFFTNVLGFIIIAIHSFAPLQFESTVMVQQLISELVLIHIIVGILSYGAFSLSFVFSLLYLLQYDLLKRKKWGTRLIRLADLSSLEKMSYLLNVIGVPLLMMSLILGTQKAYIQVPNMIWYDSKVIGSFVVLAIYSIYLYLKAGKGIAGKNLALWNIASFLIVLINFFLFGKLSNFHFWYS